MISFRVSDGAIPGVIQRFMEDECGFDVRKCYDGWNLRYVNRDGDYTYSRFDWPHDREPTLTEAIIAVANKGE